ncbi:MAG: hypothetical protein GY832_29095 [Chloroflexi bacterium]|nr:hypothetical protein [Chloroflexota bacterium]
MLISPETEASIIYCGLCVDYANPRKRARAVKWGAWPTLPGFEPPYQLHGICGPTGLTRLRHMLYKLRDQALMIVDEPGAVIPDVRQARGWDFATRWWPT